MFCITALPYRRKCAAIHFHNFMAEVHHEMKRASNAPDPADWRWPTISSRQLACSADDACDDIADAMYYWCALLSAPVQAWRGALTLQLPPDGSIRTGCNGKPFCPHRTASRIEVLHFRWAITITACLQMVRRPGSLWCRTMHAWSPRYFTPDAGMATDAECVLQRAYSCTACCTRNRLVRL